MHHASCIIHHTSYIIHHASCIMHHTSCIIHHTSYIIHHTSYIMHHTSLIILLHDFNFTITIIQRAAGCKSKKTTSKNQYSARLPGSGPARRYLQHRSPKRRILDSKLRAYTPRLQKRNLTDVSFVYANFRSQVVKYVNFDNSI